MGCSSCGSGGGTPKGCKNNGNCSSGGCNKLEVFDWLANMTLPSNLTPYDIVEVRFKNSRKNFYRNSKNLTLQGGDVVVVEEASGYDVGVVSIVGELARIQVKKKEPNLKPLEVKKIHRIASQEDIEKWIEARAKEADFQERSRKMAIELNLEMKISDVECQGDATKATFYYTADGRVDFRQLIKKMAEEFKVRIEMRQIGSRQEASRLGGIGSCGRELCCSTWLTDFRSVSTSAARYQQLSLNPLKLAGQCGKLKCCLNYELDMYVDALKSFPKTEVKLKTEKGSAYHIKTDVFKNQMWYAYEGGGMSGLIPLTHERVKEIMEMNKNGKFPADLNDFVEATIEVVEPDYSNVVGQDSLSRFENSFKKKKKKKPKNKGTNPRPENQSENKLVNKVQNPNEQRQQHVQNVSSNEQKQQGDKPFKKRKNNRNKPRNPKTENNETA